MKNKGLAKAAFFLRLWEIRSPHTDNAMHSFCFWFGSICDGITSLLKLDGSPYNNNTAEKVEEERPLSSASLLQLIHYGQIVESGEYKQYDFRSDQGNIDHYGTVNAPEIPLSAINAGANQVPIGMFVGQYDDLAVPVDCAKTNATVKNTVFYEVFPDMDHSSFLIGKTMDHMPKAIKLIEQYNVEKAIGADIAG